MSTLNTTNITNGTDSITVEGAVKGSAKAWVNFDGTGVVAIRESFNVSSITDNATGNYTVNFTTAMVDANYAFSISSSGFIARQDYLVAPTTTSVAINAYNSSNVAQDYTHNCVAIFR